MQLKLFSFPISYRMLRICMSRISMRFATMGIESKLPQKTVRKLLAEDTWSRNFQEKLL